MEFPLKLSTDLIDFLTRDTTVKTSYYAVDNTNLHINPGWNLSALC